MRINFRCFLICGIYVSLTTFAALIKNNNAVLGVIIFAFIIVSCVIFAILSYAFSVKGIKLFTFILSGIFSVLTMFCFTQTTNNWIISVDSDKSYTASGIIESMTKDDSGEVVIILTNASIDNKDIDGKIYLQVGKNLAPYSNLIGYKASFDSPLYAQNLITDYSVNSVAFRKNIRYKAYPKSVDFEYKPLTFRANILCKMQDALILALGSDYGSIAFSMLTGDKNNLDYQITDYFGISGLGHIMAVSGLHIGFIVMLLVSVSKRLKLSPKIYVPIILLFFAGYALLIGLSPSILRAIFMSSIALLTTISGKRKDQLSSLMFSLCVIVSIFPIFLFEAGFVLSFCAVLGLILFCSTIEKGLRKIKTPRFIASSLSVSAAVQIGIVPAIAFFFNQLQVYSILANVILMPFIIFTFLAIMVVLPLVLVFGALLPLLHFAGTGLVIINSVANFISRLPLSGVVVYSSIFMFTCYPLLFLISRYTMFAKFKKFISLSLCVVCLAIMFAPTAVITTKKFPLNNAIIPVNSYGEVTTITVNNGEVNIIGDFKNAASVKNLLINFNIKAVNAIVVFNITPQVAKQISKLKLFIKFNAIYCPISGLDNRGMSILAENKIDNFLIYDDSKGNSVKGLTPVTSGAKTTSFLYKFSTANVLLSSFNASYSKLDYGVVNSVNIVRCLLYEDAFEDRIFITNMPANFLSSASPTVQYSLAQMPKMLFDVSTGALKTFSM